MIRSVKVVLVALIVLCLILPMPFVISPLSPSGSHEILVTPKSMSPSHVSTDNVTPLRKVTIISEDASSYIDDFAYMAAIPSSLFYHSGTKYLSPLIYNLENDLERWLIEDWAEYLSPDGGISSVVAVGNLPYDKVKMMQDLTGAKVYPQITGSSSAEIAAKIAVNDWSSADTIILAVVEDDIPASNVNSGSFSYTFNGASFSYYHATTVIDSTTDHEIGFTPPSGVGWMEGSFNWTGSEIFTHTLRDPIGHPVDYSFYRQVVFERNTGLGYVDNPLPLYFWYPLTSDGEWTMTLEPQTQINRDIEINCSVTYYPGFSNTISVPSNTKWLNISANWDNAGTTLNFALVDPTGRLVAWSPAESLFGGAGFKSMQMPYPMSGDWTLIGAWVDPSPETNNVEIEWDIETLSSRLQQSLESAGNGAVLASLMNSPMLYVSANDIPPITSWAIERLGATTIILVDPYNIHNPAIVDTLDDIAFISTLSSHAAVSNMIYSLSDENDIVLTVPMGNGNEPFAPAAFQAAFHGSPIFSLCGSDNILTTRAEETWAPYLIGPDIQIFVVEQFTSRAENGWYDERIPNLYAMEYSASRAKAFLSSRGAYNASWQQSAMIVASPETVKVSFDRSLQSHFSTGRIPTNDVHMAAAMINKAVLHRFLFSTAANANEALISLYAYTLNSTPYIDNFGEIHLIQQIQGTVEPLESMGFTISPHVGVNEVYQGVASQVALWSFSTHGTLTESPTDPPQRPNGLGVFSLRDVDIPYGQEADGVRDVDGKGLVNPVVYESENAHHVIQTTMDLEAAIDNIGSPIVILTACLLGGSELPLMLMEHGAVAVTAAPRTVYFRAAGLLSILFTHALTEGNTTGDALSYALSAISYDYTNPQSGNPNDYANQQVLFGDPDIHLYHPSTHSRIPSVSPEDINANGHAPSHGVTPIAGLGASDYLPAGFASIALEFDYYESSNFSDFLTLLELRRTVLIDSQSLVTLESDLLANTDRISEFVHNGGTLVAIGISQDLSWLPWFIDFESGTDNTITILDSNHPLMSTPNVLDDDYASVGILLNELDNFTALASNNAGNVVAAGHYGNGKIALMTLLPSGSNRDALLENIAAWNTQPSLILWSINKSQEIIWEGDRVTLTLQITNEVGVPVDDVSLTVLVNESQVSAQEISAGQFVILLDEAWTSANQGHSSIEIRASKNGYDTLSVVLADFLFIRISPLPLIIIGGGILMAVVGGVYYRKRKIESSRPRVRKPRPVKHRESKEERRRREMAEKERKRKREEEEGKFDPKEFFGV